MGMIREILVFIGDAVKKRKQHNYNIYNHILFSLLNLSIYLNIQNM